MVNNKLIPAPILSSALLPPLSSSLWPGARPDLTLPGLVVWGAGRRFSIISAAFGCKVRMDVWVVIAVVDTKYEAIIHKIYLTLANIC